MYFQFTVFGFLPIFLRVLEPSLGGSGIHLVITMWLRLEGPQFGQCAEDRVPRVSLHPFFLKSEVVPGSFAGKASTEWGRYEIAAGSINRRWSDPRLSDVRQ